MTASLTVLCASSLLPFCAGCASIASAAKAKTHSPRFYAGTRLDLAALDYDRDTLDHYSSYDILPPGRPGVDLPFSVIADTVLFPFEVLYTISEPALGNP